MLGPHPQVPGYQDLKTAETENHCRGSGFLKLDCASDSNEPLAEKQILIHRPGRGPGSALVPTPGTPGCWAENCTSSSKCRGLVLAEGGYDRLGGEQKGSPSKKSTAGAGGVGW